MKLNSAPDPDSDATEPSRAGVERGKRKYNVPAAEKALDVIEYASAMPDGATATELAVGLGRGVHEIYRVVQVLEARGYLYRPPGSDRYRLSMKLFELAHRMPATRQLSDAALPIIQMLAPATMQSCHLAVPSGGDMLIVIQADPPLPMRYSVSLGARFPFDETSTGLVVYAYSDANARATFEGHLAASEQGEKRLQTVRRQAEEILSVGHDLRPSLSVGGVTNIAVPIFDYLGHVVAALMVAYLPQRAATVPIETVLEQTIDAGRRLSTQLGAGSRLSSQQEGETANAG